MMRNANSCLRGFFFKNNLAIALPSFSALRNPMYRISKWKKENEGKQNRHYITLSSLPPYVVRIGVHIRYLKFQLCPLFMFVWASVLALIFRLSGFMLFGHPFYVVSCVPTNYWLLIFVLVYVRLIREHFSWRAASPWSHVKSQACGVSQSVVLIKKYDFSNCHFTDLTKICKIFSVICRSVCPNGVSTWTLW